MELTVFPTFSSENGKFSCSFTAMLHCRAIIECSIIPFPQITMPVAFKDYCGQDNGVSQNVAAILMPNTPQDQHSSSVGRLPIRK